MPVLDIEKVDRLKQILKWHPRGITISDLAARMDMNRNLVAKYLDMLLISGQVDMEVVGAAKVYFLSRRVPISSMLEFSSDMVIVLDREQKIIQVNDPLLRMLREKKDALVGRQIRDIDNPFFRAVPITVPSKDTDALGQVREMACTLEGKKHHFRVKQLQTAFEDGNQGITLIVEDISAQVMYQEMLEINEARYRGIVEDQTEFITRFLPDGKLIFVNDAYARYLGKNKEELLGGPHIPHPDVEDIPAVSRSIRSLSTDNPAITFECRIHHDCGKDRWNLWTVRALFDDENKPVEYQGIGRDNTEKREAAARINQYIKDMEFLSRKAQEFVDLSPNIDIFYVIGEGLSELIPEAVFVINSYDPVSDTLTVRAVFSENDRKNLTTCLGRDVLGFRFPLGTVPEQLRTLSFNQLQTGRVIHIEENLYDIFFQQIPPDVCDRIEASLGVKDGYYCIGLFRHGIFFGNVTFALRKGKTLHNPSLVETYIHQASIILHRKFSEEALKESEARYRGIVDDQTELVIRFLPDWTLSFINTSGCRIFQKECHELLGCPITSLIPEEDHERVLHEIQTLNSDNQVHTIEFRVLDPSGNKRWFQWTNRLLLNHSGRCVEYQGVGRDITGQKEAEAKIRQYIADREFLTQTALGFMNLRDDENLYQYIADQMYTLIPGQIVAISSINPSERTVILQSVAGLDESVFEEFRNLGVFLLGKSFSLDKDPDVEAILKTKYLTPGPTLFNLLFREFPQEVCIQLGNRIGFGKSYVMGFVHEGTIFGSVVIILRPGQELKNKEILELFLNQASIALLHKHARQDLRNSEKIYRSVIENIQDVFYRSDTAGNLIMASPSWAKMLGYTSLDDCIGYNIAEKFWFEPALRKKFLDAINRDGSVSDYEVVLKCRDGSPLYVSTNSHLFYDDAGSLLGVEGIFRDISEHRTAAEKIRDTLSQIEFFSRKLQEFIELPPASDIYYAIGQGLKELLPDGMIIVNTYDRDKGTLTIKALVGDKARATALKYLQSDLTGISLQVDEPVPENIQAGKIYPVKRNFYSILSRNFSQDVSAAIVQELDLGNFYYISLVWGESFLGNITFGLPKGQKLEKAPFIEVYGKAASIVLQREIAEESLKKSQEIFSNVATYAPVPIAIIEPDGRYTFINQKFTEIFGYDLHDFTTGKEWFSRAYPDPEYRKKVIASWKSDLRASKSGQQRPEIFTVRCKNGLDREILFRPVSLSDGKECVVYEDVTEQHKTEEIQRLLSSIVETSRDAIISKKTDGTIISWNKAAEQLYGYTTDEMIGRNISTIIPQERHGEMSEIIDRIKKGDSVNNLETLRVRKDGKIIDVAVTISPLTNEAGMVIGASTIGRDISFKKSEERLLESEEKYRTIVENMKIGMYRSTGDPKGRFVWGNTSLLEILGYPSFDTLSQIDVTDLFAEPGGRAMFLADLRQSGFVMNRKLYLKRSDGSRICVRVTALAKYNLKGDIEFINGTVEDITEHEKDTVHLQQLRQELLDIIDFFPDPAFLIDQHRQVVAWNSAMEHLTGVGRNEIIGYSRYDHAFITKGTPRPVLIDLLEAPDAEIGNHYSHVTREGSSLVAECYMPSLFSGRGAYVWMKASPLFDPAGNKIGAIEIIRDLSKVKEIEESLHFSTGSGPDIRGTWSMPADSSRGFPDQGTIDTPGIFSPLYLSQALKTAQDYIAILDKSGKCLWANDSLVHAVKAEHSSDLAGKSLALFIAPEFRKLALNCLTDARKNGHKIIPLMMLSASGRIPVEASISAIMAKNGNFFGFFTVARNVEREKVDRPG
jgi:PAS domain S-box-containing protein